MNYQFPFGQPDPRASLVSSRPLNYAQLLTPLTNNIQELYKTPQITLYQNQLAQIASQPLALSQLKTSPILLRNDGYSLKQFDPFTPSLSIASPNPASLPISAALLNPMYGINTSRIATQSMFLDKLPQLDPSLLTQHLNSQVLLNPKEKAELSQQIPLSTQSNAGTSDKPSEASTAMYWPQNYATPLRISSKRPRRKAAEIERTHRCPIEGCQKSYG